MSDESTTTDFPKAYDPTVWEDRLYARWEKSGFFNPDACIAAGVTAPDAGPFSIVLPPPNVTGTLHTGSACMLAIEDLIVRFKRMQGYRTLWVPGTDHAAIATQSKVEKIIYQSEGKTRHDLGREELLRRVEAFAQESHDTIVHQTKKLGSSLDWSREAYTLDDKRSLAVRTAFKRMYDDGLIYRGNRIVNWDPNLQTTVSDDEIEWREEKIPFYYLQYGPFVISTARPETKFGDKYVVMHPDDERYAAYADGQKLTVEWINGPIEATIVKDTVIDMAFGTGVMTITPWHDHTDFDIAERHGLDREQIIGEDGKLLAIAGEFSGLPIAEAREKIIAKLTTKGLVVKTDADYVHNVAINSRGGGIIEPQIKRQWFVAVNKEFERAGRTVTLKTLMQDAVRSKAVDILPERFEKIYFHWIDNLRDWCISRQIWFGHRIPVWYRGNETYCGIEAPDGDGWQQDPDTLDTWFSSGLWTFSTLGWPDESAVDLKTYHPTVLLETAYDILFFWVARMILMSEYFFGKAPFQTVYLHGLVRDEQGRKMSKSLDNIVDPLDVIAENGADALRLALVVGSTPGNDLKLSTEKTIAMRNFVNKLWNMGRYLTSSVTPESICWDQPARLSGHLSPADTWILERLETVRSTVSQRLDTYNISLAAETLRDFTWNEFADWYIEIHKIEKHDTVLVHVFNELLKLWHPFMPFVTEALYTSLYPNEKYPLMVQRWNTPAAPHQPDSTIASDFLAIIDLIQKIRNVRAVYHIDPKETLSLTLIGDAVTLTPFTPIIERLGRVAEVLITDAVAARPAASASIIAGGLRAFVHLGDVIDVAAEKARLEKETAELGKYIAGLKTRLADAGFTEKAPENIISAQRTSLATAETKLITLSQSIQELSS